jgi:flagellar biosynthesis protein FlhG
MEKRVAPTVLAIGGGKGGTGKSAIAVQLGIVLAEYGLRVVLADLDPNGPNLHTFFGLEDPAVDLDHLLEGEATPLEVILPTGIRDLGLVAGSRQELRSRMEPDFLVESAERLRFEQADVVVWDVGSGASMWSTYLFEQADVGCWVATPEPTCAEKEYHFLRHVCRWRVASLLEPDLYPPSGWLPVPWLSSVNRTDPALARQLQEQLRSRPVLLIANQIFTPEERAFPEDMMAACRRFFGIHGEALGALPYDERVWLSVRQRRPIVLEYPESRWVEQFRQCVELLQPFLESPHIPG